MKSGPAPQMFCECGNPLDSQSRTPRGKILGCKRCRKLQSEINMVFREQDETHLELRTYSLTGLRSRP